MTAFALVTAYTKVCSDDFFTQAGYVGPNAGQHEEFGPQSHCEKNKNHESFLYSNPLSAPDLSNLSGYI